MRADESTIKKMISYATAMNSANGMRDTKRIAQGLLAAHPNEFDTDPWKFNCLNGTIDLRTGALLPHNRLHRITKRSPVEYRPDATCPLWLQFLDTIFAGNQSLIEYLRRWFGYCLTADIREQVMPVFWGDGSNGKSTLLNTIRSIWGEYAMQAPAGFLTVKQNESHPTELADLQSQRLVVATETENGKKLPEAKVKALTGGEPVRAHRMCRDNVEFNSTAKIVLVTNHLPSISGTDEGIWRRIHMVPFTVKIPDDKKDKELPDKLLRESAGILSWCVLGCLEWQRSGLLPPQEVTKATAGYREKEDVLAAFLDARCIVAPDAIVGSTALLNAYKTFTGDKAMTARPFADLLREHGFQNGQATAGGLKGRAIWTGLRLLTEADAAAGFIASRCVVDAAASVITPVLFGAYTTFTGNEVMKQCEFIQLLETMGFTIDGGKCHGLRLTPAGRG